MDEEIFFHFLRHIPIGIRGVVFLNFWHLPKSLMYLLILKTKIRKTDWTGVAVLLKARCSFA